MGNFILVGRSMGAAAIVMLMKDLWEKSIEKWRYSFTIMGLILDSPYFNL